MITEHTIYWITRLDLILMALEIVLTVFGVCFVGAILYTVFTWDDTNYHIKQIISVIILFIISLILLTGIVLIPDTKTMIAIKVIPKIANNEELKGLTDKSMQLIDMNLDKWMNSITKPNIKEEEK